MPQGPAGPHEPSWPPTSRVGPWFRIRTFRIRTMDASEHAHPLPGAMPPSSPSPSSPEGDKPRWPPSVGLIGLMVALIATFVISGIVATIYVLLGYDDPQD